MLNLGFMFFFTTPEISTVYKSIFFSVMQAYLNLARSIKAVYYKASLPEFRTVYKGNFFFTTKQAYLNIARSIKAVIVLQSKLPEFSRVYKSRVFYNCFYRPCYIQVGLLCSKNKLLL